MWKELKGQRGACIAGFGGNLLKNLINFRILVRVCVLYVLALILTLYMISTVLPSNIGIKSYGRTYLAMVVMD